MGRTAMGRPFRHKRPRGPKDPLNDARRLASIGTYFIVIGWIFVAYAIIARIFWWVDLVPRPAVNFLHAPAIFACIFWWIDLVQRPVFSFLEALAISLGAIGLPFFLAVLVLGLGYTM